LHENAAPVREVHRQPVELGLDRVLHLLERQRFAHAAIEGAHLVLGERVRQRKHRRAVPDLGERRERRCADALGGRVGRRELRVLGLEALQLGEQLVVGGVRDLGRVFHVIEAIVALELPA
jgi:hypothetical protein